LEVGLRGLKAQISNKQFRVDGLLLSSEDCLGALSEPSPPIIGAAGGFVGCRRRGSG
jgi:hypothetical protein